MNRWLVVVAVVMAPITDAMAGGRLVVESYAGRLSDDVDLLMAPVRSVLERRGHVTNNGVFEASSGLPLENRMPAASAIERLQNQVNAGFRHWDDVEFDAVITTFTEALSIAHRFPMTLTRSAALRTQLFRAHVILALAHKRSGDIAASRRVMADVVRSFPDKKISYKQFGTGTGSSAGRRGETDTRRGASCFARGNTWCSRCQGVPQ